MFSSAPWAGPAILAVFVMAYALVFAEERLHLRKSKPVMVAAGIIWVLVALAFHAEQRPHEVADKARHILLEYAELFLFLLSAMSFVNTMVERNVFGALRARLVAAKFSMRTLYWITGTAAFFLSPIADNLTTALVMGTVVLSTFGRDRKVVSCGLVNVVVAANAGGAFSPFGDITTLMVWQKGVVQFTEFFALFIPSLVNWLIPAAIMSFMIPRARAEGTKDNAKMRQGGLVVVALFLATVCTTVLLDHALHLPPFLGMMMGLGVLKVFGYFLHNAERKLLAKIPVPVQAVQNDGESWPIRKPFDIFGILEKVEWDTLLFFYGVMLCVGGIGAIGYLDLLSGFLYRDLGGTTANTLIGLLSAIVDNIPLTFAVLTMNPEMNHGQWLLMTLTAGVGGSLLSIGSAAGVALMGIGKGHYTFMSHLRWSWAILLGFAASIATHLIINADKFAP